MSCLREKRWRSCPVARPGLSFRTGTSCNKECSGSSAVGRRTQEYGAPRLYRLCWVSARATLAGPHRYVWLKAICLEPKRKRPNSMSFSIRKNAPKGLIESGLESAMEDEFF